MINEIDNLAQTQLRKVVTDRLRSAILENELKPGDWLRQEQLAEKFGVSQTPVREALKDLVAEGLVEHVPYRGVRVIEFALEDMLDLYACRAFMEGLAARYAVQNITSHELAELDRLLDELEQHPAREHLVEHRRLNRKFHQVIYTASRHAYLTRTLDQMWTAFPTMMLTDFARTAEDPIPRRGASSTQEHRDIAAALKARDGEQAERLMQSHIQVSAERIAAVIETRS
jgi:DNA-binding GntR family transcriptional regulator